MPVTEGLDIVEVVNAQHEKQFLAVASSIYANSKNWIRPLDDDINKVFSDKNRFYRNGEAKRWLALSKGKLVGRIAAFHSKEFSFKGDHKTGGLGFFECIDDQPTANALLPVFVRELWFSTLFQTVFLWLIGYRRFW